MASRRDLLKATGGALAFAVAPELRADLGSLFLSAPELDPADGTPEARTARRVLQRVTFGPRPGDVARVASRGVRGFVEEQLAPGSIRDPWTFFRVRRLESVGLDVPDLFDWSAKTVLSELRAATILRATVSERQLFEVMVEFWGDHFNVFADKGDGAWLKVVDDREVVRKHALGRFRDLLFASVTSPAMLVYLDGVANVAGRPNENHARELLELHTLGVTGGYRQRDVMELARALTGWRLRSLWHRGRRVLEADRHDGSPKVILGARLSGEAEEDLTRIVDLLAAHKATARFVATKLCRRFIGEAPGEALVSNVARSFTKTGGDIRAALSTLLLDGALVTSAPKLKRPFRFAVSALRALGARTDGGTALQAELDAMGQLPFAWPTPDGYPEEEGAWSSRLLPRWSFASRLFANEIRGTRVPDALREVGPARLATALLGRVLDARERRAFALGGPASVLCHPEFQLQ